MKLNDPGDGRKSRFHTMDNVRVSGSRIVRNAPRAALSYATFKLAGARPERPWISYDATRRLEGLLKPTMKVLEYGTGMSTMWFAARVASVLAVDHSGDWIDYQRARIKDRGIANVTLVHAEDEHAFVYPEGVAPRMFDFIMIDGDFWREQCARAALELLVPGGWVYLDNTDKTDGTCGDGAAILSNAARERGGTVETFTDFVPTLAHPTTGSLYRL